MENRQNFTSIAKLLIIIAYGGFFTYCGGKQEPVIATVNDTQIALETFKPRYWDS